VDHFQSVVETNMAAEWGVIWAKLEKSQQMFG
jgi:hypothetical protein